MSKIRILIVEDHSLTRVGLKFTLEKYENLEIVGEAENGKEGVELATSLKPNVILMDLAMPVMNGIEATKELRKKDLECMIMMLTSHNTKDEVLAAFSAGADAYCMKDIPPEKLVTAIESVNDGVVWIDPAIAEIVLTMLPEPKPAKDKPSSIEDFGLTAREIEVLKLITEGYSNADIAYTLTVSMHTVKTHISNILSKLGVNDRTQAAVKALKDGYFED